MRSSPWLWLLVLWLWPVAAVHAQGNDQFAPTGGRSALMGNTGVALARDGAAPFYNPATIVRIRDERLAFSVNFYSLSSVNVSDFHRPGTVDQNFFGRPLTDGTSLLTATFRVLPSTLCLFFTLQDLAQLSGEQAADTPSERVPRTKLAVCFASVESEDLDLQALRFSGTTPAGPTEQVLSLQRRWSRTYIGPTYSTYLNRSFAIGASLFAAYSYTSFGMHGSTLSQKLDGGSLASSLGTSGSGYSFELTGVLGASYHYDPLTLGISLRVPSLHMFGSHEGTFDRSNSGADSDTALVYTAKGSMRAVAPVRAAFGIGYVSKKLTLEADAAVCIPLEDELQADLKVTRSSTAAGATLEQERVREKYSMPSHLTVSPSAGFEYFISPSFSWLGGASANFSSLDPLRPRPSVGNLVQARTHHIDVSTGLGSYWDGGELLFGVQLDFGWGQALAINPYLVPNDWSVVSTQSYGMLFVISGATDLGAIMRVVRRITVGEEPNTPPPAKASQSQPPAHGDAAP